MTTVVGDDEVSIARKFSFCGCMAVVQYHARALCSIFGEDALATMKEAASLRQVTMQIFHCYVGDKIVVAPLIHREKVHKRLQEKCEPMFRRALHKRQITGSVDTIKDWFDEVYDDFIDRVVQSQDIFRISFLHFITAAIFAEETPNDDNAMILYQTLKTRSPIASSTDWGEWCDQEAACLYTLTHGVSEGFHRVKKKKKKRKRGREQEGEESDSEEVHRVKKKKATSSSSLSLSSSSPHSFHIHPNQRNCVIEPLPSAKRPS